MPTLFRFSIPVSVLVLVTTLGLGVRSIHAADPLANVTCATSPNFGLVDLTEWAAGMGTPLLKATVPDAEAICNDGTPAVIYIRPANAQQAGEIQDGTVDPSNSWWIHFVGGGTCEDTESCYRRWCSLDPEPFSRAGKMSSAGTPDAVVDGGPFYRDPTMNDFAGWNHVILYYCSSDMWAGSATHQSVETSDANTFDIAFRGEAIVNAVFNWLLGTTVGPDPGLPSHFWNQTLPKLSDAEEVLLGGSSAGGGGVRFHADRLAALLGNNGTRVEAVIDAGFPATLDDPGWTGWNAGSPGDYEGVLDEVVMPSHRGYLGQSSSATDASCLTSPYAVWMSATPPDRPERECFDPGVLLEQHVETPFFVRMNLNDELPIGRYLNWGLVASVDDYIQANYDELLGLPTVSASSDVGVLGQVCGVGNHVALTNNQGFYGTQVRLNTATPPLTDPSFHDLLSDWYFSGATVLSLQPNLGTWAGSQSVGCQ